MGTTINRKNGSRPYQDCEEVRQGHHCFQASPQQDCRLHHPFDEAHSTWSRPWYLLQAPRRGAWEKGSIRPRDLRSRLLPERERWTTRGRLRDKGFAQEPWFRFHPSQCRRRLTTTSHRAPPPFRQRPSCTRIGFDYDTRSGSKQKSHDLKDGILVRVSGLGCFLGVFAGCSVGWMDGLRILDQCEIFPTKKK